MFTSPLYYSSVRWRRLFVGQRFFIAVLSLFGFGFVLIATSRYGAGLSPDSVDYISAARNLAVGNGLLLHNGNWLLSQPPLYSMLLALIYWLFGIDPLQSAHVVNALVFGSIIYTTGLLMVKHLGRSAALAIIGVLFTLFSVPLFTVSMMVWTEPLFVLLVLLFFLAWESYLQDGGSSSFWWVVFLAALACLTRYIGIVLVLSGAAIILWRTRGELRHRLLFSFLFGLASILPLCAWMFRNYWLQGTLMGPRFPSSFTLLQNLTFVFDTISSWFLPGSGLLLFLLGGIGLYLDKSDLKKRWPELLSSLCQVGPILLFILVYTLFVVFSATIVVYDKIGTRLLSPIFVPLLLLILLFARRVIVGPLKRRFPTVRLNYLWLVILAASLSYPSAAMVWTTVDRFRHGAGGFNTTVWRESQLLQYVVQQSWEDKPTIYSNGPDALYIVADLEARMSPMKAASSHSSEEPRELEESWPQSSDAYLIWFNFSPRDYLYTVEELRATANVSPIAQFSDGGIYTVSNKEDSSETDRSHK